MTNDKDSAVTQADRDVADAHFDIWYPDTAWGFDALAETLAHHRQHAYDQGYYDGCTRSVMQSDVSFRELSAVLYRKSAEFQVGLTVADSYTLAAEAIAFLQEQSK